jgi:hypothetical protein
LGDRVSVEGSISSTVASDGYAFVRSDTGETYRIWCEDLTLVEQPKRKLRVGSVWECNASQRYVYLGKDRFSGWGPHETIGRDQLTIDSDPQYWREVPVEELEQEAADGS